LSGGFNIEVKNPQVNFGGELHHNITQETIHEKGRNVFDGGGNNDGGYGPSSKTISAAG
jgi:hypothetical protein